MARFLFERLDGAVGWFETDGAPAPELNNPFAKAGDSVWERYDGEREKRVWIRFFWVPLGVRKPMDRQHTYWQISAREAAAWYSANGKNPPETLLVDLQAEQEAAKAPKVVVLLREGKQPVTTNVSPETFLDDAPDTESRVAEILRADPRAKSQHIGKLLRLTAGSIRNTRAWKENRESLAKQKTQRSARTVPLSDGILAMRPSDAGDPAKIVEEQEEHGCFDGPEIFESIEIIERKYLERATSEQKNRFYQMSRADREHELQAWNLTGERAD